MTNVASYALMTSPQLLDLYNVKMEQRSMPTLASWKKPKKVLIDRLVSLDNDEQPVSTPSTTLRVANEKKPLAGHHVSIMGTFGATSRKDIAQFIIRLGGTVSGYFTRNTSYVVAGQNVNGTARRTAVRRNAKIITLDDLKAL